MTPRLREKGRFIKKNVLDKKSKAIAAMTEARKQKNQNIPQKSDCESTMLRIVDIALLGKNLKCDRCNQRIFLDNIVKEVRFGLTSMLHIKCETCVCITLVSTGKCLEPKSQLYDTNMKAVLGKYIDKHSPLVMYMFMYL